MSWCGFLALQLLLYLGYPLYQLLKISSKYDTLGYFQHPKLTSQIFSRLKNVETSHPIWSLGSIGLQGSQGKSPGLVDKPRIRWFTTISVYLSSTWPALQSGPFFPSLVKISSSLVWFLWTYCSIWNWHCISRSNEGPLRGGKKILNLTSLISICTLRFL